MFGTKLSKANHSKPSIHIRYLFERVNPLVLHLHPSEDQSYPYYQSLQESVQVGRILKENKKTLETLSGARLAHCFCFIISSAYPMACCL